MSDLPRLTDTELETIARRIKLANTFAAGYVAARHNVVKIDAPRLLQEIYALRAERRDPRVTYNPDLARAYRSVP